MSTMKSYEFARRLKSFFDESPDCRFVFFLGAGCSVSSGIPAAGELVKKWLPELKKIKTGDDTDYEKWTAGKYKGYDPGKPAKIYSKVIKERFPTLRQRQEAIECLTTHREPGFGYAVLAQLLANEKCGKKCNVVMTTNFDDLVADSLLYYASKKPFVISHESLAKFADVLRVRPTVIKLHGDAMLEPKNTEEEIYELAQELKQKVHEFLSHMGLVFIGYGGNDMSIADCMKNLPANSLPFGVYWVSEYIPETPFGDWLKELDKKNNLFWVQHKDFDELMLLLLKEFGLPHPDENRFKNLVDSYHASFVQLDLKITNKSPLPKFEQIAENTVTRLPDWYLVELEASEYKKTDSDKANAIYLKGIEDFPNSPILVGNYAIFLHEIRKDYDQAEKFYRKAIDLDPKNPIICGGYAFFLKNVRKDYDRAEKLYRKAVDLNPNNPFILGSYALFLKDIRKDYDQAEKFYQKAIDLDPSNPIILVNYILFVHEVRKDYDLAEKLYRKAIDLDPNNPNIVGNFALFMHQIRKNYDLAEKFYRKAIDLDPNNPNTIGNFALFLYQVRKDYDQAENFYRKAIDLDPNRASIIGNFAAFLCEIRKDYAQAEKYFKKALDLDPDNVIVLRTYALLLEVILKDYDQAEIFYKKVIKLNPNDTINLYNFANFLENIRKEYDQAEEFYQKALDIDPNFTNTLDHYVLFLHQVRKDYNKAEKFYRKVIDLNPNNANNLGNFAGFLLGFGRTEEGFEYLEKAISSADRDDLKLECAFYGYAHYKDETRRKECLLKANELIKSGIRSPGWNLKLNVERSKQDGHPAPKFLEALSKVIADEMDVKELERFPEWNF